MPEQADQRSEAELRAYPEWLEQRENTALRRRREQLPAPHAVAPDAPRVGLALSGGGIRSATFSLGLVQALARSGVLPRIDYLSTVSGGGYIGSFLGALYARGAQVEEVLHTLTHFPEAPPLAWLRSNGRFLAPNGAGANWLAGAVLLRNWLSLLFVLAPVAFFLAFVRLLARAGVLAVLAHPRVAMAWPRLEVAGVVASPMFVLPALCALYWMLPCWLAYWMVNSGQFNSRPSSVTAGAVLAVILLPTGLAYHFHSEGSLRFPLVAGFVGVTAIVFCWAAWLRHELQRRRVPTAPQGAKAEEGRFNPFGPDRDNIARNKLSEWLKGGFVAVVLTAVIALLDSLAFQLFERLEHDGLAPTLQKLAALATAASGVVLATHRILAQLGSSRKQSSGGFQVPVGVLVGIAALLAIFLGDVVIQTATYLLVNLGGHPNSGKAALGVDISFLVLVLLGRFQVFVNQSSLGPIYNARLTRAYVGASNPNRWRAESKFRGKESPIEPIPGDQLHWDEYKPHEQGGPVHLINVTVNETVDPRVQLHQPDRKGMIMAVGPEGVSLGVRHHAPWDGELPREPDASTFQVFPTGKELLYAEKLPLGHWVAVSGAAVAPGLGQLSLTGASLLLGILNMRLGYWWFSNVSARGRRHQARAVSLGASLMSVLGYLFPVYRLLAAEFLDRFPGTAIPYWYLTDGGHLENTGCYELIRRRVPFILCVDNGADPQAQCSDVANLVRLARVDFGAEIEFLDREQLDTLLDPSVARYFGELQQLEHDGPAPMVYAGLARVRYADSAAAERGASWLLVVKPRVLGAEALDITAYGLSNATFPQQSTADQSFDDAQWEAYRKLGDFIGSQLFDNSAERSADQWCPKWLDQQALELLHRQHPPDSSVRRKRGRSEGPGRGDASSGRPVAGAS